MTVEAIAIHPAKSQPATSAFPLDQWSVAGFSSELTDKLGDRTFPNQKVVIFRTGDS